MAEDNNIDKKTVFLKDLAECLKRHSAKIVGTRMSAYIDGEAGAIIFCDSKFNDFTELNADNVRPTYE